jgi:hypothetical protein
MRARSRNIDTSPYSSNNTAYLSPPESSWRRTSSDSAIHQSLAQAQVRQNIEKGIVRNLKFRTLLGHSRRCTQFIDAKSTRSQKIIQQPK